MAQLFSIWTLKDNTLNLPWFDQSKIEIIQELYADYKNWLLEDEVKYKEKFNQIFFWELLWYENRIHRIPEWHIKWVGNADIVLWNFVDGKEEADNIQIVCELKGSKSNLVKKQYWHGGLSPVGQWFSYKTWLKNTKWLIVSNFFEIRLYRDNQTDFELRNLETLLNPKDNYFNLKSLYLLLHKDNLLADNWTSKTEELLSFFRDEQLAITKKFYKEYKQLRLELLEDIKQKNPMLSVNTLVEKGQKIIDRLIFVFFCEDRGLLPDKKLKEWIVNAEQRWFTPREMTKRFFKGVDEWNEKLGIPDWYNWWLFKEDTILNSLKVGDEICKNFVELTNYDFHDDLSVNVLGHIFEQSITDLEEIKEDLVGKESKVLQESKWRRKKDWIFYTPEYIVDYIVQNSVMKYLNEKEDVCLKKYKNKKNWEVLAYQEYQHILQNIKVLDPACGSWAFLVRVFDVLFEENKRVGSILNSLFDDTEVYKNILTNNIYGVDLNDESVEISKLSLWLKSAQKGKKLNNLDKNIRCGNSLIDDSEIAGDKAFDWNIEFKEIMDEGGFDVIVWNPPYVVLDSKNNWITYFKKIFNVSSWWKINLYKLFFEKSITILWKNGFLWFITPSNYLTSSDSKNLREFFLYKTKILEIVDYPESDNIFQDVTQWVATIILKKQIDNKNIFNYKKESKNNLIKYTDIENNNKKIFRYKPKEIIKIEKQKSVFGDVAEIFQWEINVSTKKDFFVNNKKEDYLPLYRWNNIWRYFVKEVNEKFAPINISNRDHYSKERIVFQEVSNIWLKVRINGIILNNVLCGHTTNYMFSKKWDINILYLLSVLNSSIINYFFKHFNQTNHVPVWEIKTIPFPKISPTEQQPFIEKADKMLELNKEFHEKIDIILT